MKKLLLGLALALFATSASAQTCPTRPTSDSSNACASTAFVHNVASSNAITALTGDGSATGPGSVAFTLNNLRLGTVTVIGNLPIANSPTMGANTVLGSIAGGTGAALTKTQLTTLCNTFTTTLSGCAAASGGGTTNFLRADGTWAAPSGGSAITALTSDVTATGPGSAVATIANNAVTNAKAAQMAAGTIKGNNTTALANSVDMTVAQFKTLTGARLSVKDPSCGALGDGSTNDTTAIQTCLTNLIAAGGGTLWFPAAPNCYITNATLTINLSAIASSYSGRIQIEGEGSGSTCIKNTTSATATLSLTGNASFPDNYFLIRGLRIVGNGVSGNSCLSLSIAAFTKLDDFYAYGCDTGLTTVDVDQIGISNSFFRFNNNGIIGNASVSVSGPNSWTLVNTAISNNNFSGMQITTGFALNILGGSIQFNGTIACGGTIANCFGLKVTNYGSAAAGAGVNIQGVDFEANGGTASLWFNQSSTAGTTNVILNNTFNRNTQFALLGYGTNNILFAGSQVASYKLTGNMFASSNGYTPSTARPSIGLTNTSATIINDGSNSYTDAIESPANLYPGAGWIAINTPLINAGVRAGGFDVWQTGTSIAQAASTTAYVNDGWYLLTNANQAATVTQVTGIATGSQWAAKVQRNNGQTGTGVIRYAAPLDSDEIVDLQGSFAALSFTIKEGANQSFSHTVTYTLYCGTGSPGKRGVSAYTGETTPITGTVTTTTTAQRVTATSTAIVPINCTQLEMQFNVTPSGTAGADDSFTVDDLQLQPVTTASNSASPYQRTNMATQLAKAQRFRFAYAPGGSNQVLSMGAALSTTQTIGVMQYPVQMRVAPTLITNGNFQAVTAGGGLATGACTLSLSDANTFLTEFVCNVTSGLVAGNASFVVFGSATLLTLDSGL